LAPIVCSSPAEQAEFYERFDRWVQSADPSAHEGAPDPELHEHETWIARWWRRIKYAVAVEWAPLLVGVIFGGLLLLREGVAPAPGGAKAAAADEGTGWVWRAWLVVALELAALPLLLLLAWRLLVRARARLYLERRWTRGTPAVGELFVQGLTSGLFQSLPLDHIIRGLRRRQPLPSGELDITATVAATVRRGGYFTPVAEPRYVVPEYLALVDRRGPADQEARLHDELLDRLAANDVYVVRYSFDGDPRLCTPGTGGGGAVSPSELAARYPNHRLLLFTDGVGLLSPFSGRPAAWLDQLASWPERALLTPTPVGRWGYREQALAGSGLLVQTVTGPGLAALAEQFDGAGAPAAPAAEPDPPFPARLRGSPRRWLDRVEPEPAEVEALLEQLRHYLGADGWYWLAASAVYPALDWRLTVYLGTNLPANGRPLFDERRLAALVRLPWFRYGAMPDWLRQRLLAELTPPAESAVRAALQALLLTALNGPLQGFRLEVAREQGGVLGRLAAAVVGLLIRRAPADSPLHDRVFARFMAGPGPGRLALEVTAALVKALRAAPPALAGWVARQAEQRRQRREARREAAPTAAAAATEPAPSPARSALAAYSERMARAVPLPSIAMYVAGLGIIRSAGLASVSPETVLYAMAWPLFLGCLALSPFWGASWERPFFARGAWPHRALSAALFESWAYALGGPFALAGWYQPIVASVLLVGFTVATIYLSPPTMTRATPLPVFR
jgi:hypothetical protein